MVSACESGSVPHQLRGLMLVLVVFRVPITRSARESRENRSRTQLETPLLLSPLSGDRTASGSKFDNRRGCAHGSYPFGTVPA